MRAHASQTFSFEPVPMTPVTFDQFNAVGDFFVEYQPLPKHALRGPPCGQAGWTAAPHDTVFDGVAIVDRHGTGGR
jgi:hypothetical protein